MSFRASLKNLIRRDPATRLRGRADDLRVSLAGQTRRTIVAGSVAAAVPLPAMAAARTHEPTEYADHRDRLLAAYAEDRACRPIDGEAQINSIEDVACTLVERRCWALAEEVATLPPPRTLDGLGVVALAATILWEVSHSEERHDVAAVSLIRSVLAMTGTELPPRFSGFGDEPDVKERDTALYDAEGSLPAWAIAEAKAEYDFDDA
ncbi:MULTISPECIES: hypothetical protein [unclassified Methylobacterium]|uniref:hypothetical protein n=1 Tax=unclassified Methylobacterium TaxID=2615210 RepID=UPI001FBA014E|nr:MULTISPECIES: hypothetical protein [unclassified Methylobacterium]MCJ2093987.1 hypothetical protein [Methylobacterium sp. J-072]MCJ2138584.1 hypothetical protein [Methylobacterium sp. E-066]